MADLFELEHEIVEYLKSALYTRMRFLALPLGSLETVFSAEVEKIAVCGETLRLNPCWLRECFRSGSVEGILFILHSLYHCLLGHPWQGQGFLTPEWDLACDLAVWRLIGETWPGELPPDYGALCADAAEAAGAAMTAGALYPALEGAAGELGGRFCLDDHRPWREARQRERAEYSGLGTGGRGDRGAKQRWQDLAAQTRRALESQRRRGGSARRNLRTGLVLGADPARRSAYGAVLRRFTRSGETARINMDEFQYAWYHYGLEQYGKMPIIEPLEYQERRALGELGIVIDSSASCSRDLTRRFLQETCAILREENLFFERFNLHIIQCDNRVQRDDKITCMEDFSAYLRELEITGQGGTDFRPAFEHIDGLLRKGEFSRLPGILYFTDGSGFYPARMPEYETVFVFIRDRYDAIDLPDWACRLVLEPDEGF
jgi:predicted metal-dependent peptidase